MQVRAEQPIDLDVEVRQQRRIEQVYLQDVSDASEHPSGFLHLPHPGPVVPEGCGKVLEILIAVDQRHPGVASRHFEISGSEHDHADDLECGFVANREAVGHDQADLEQHQGRGDVAKIDDRARRVGHGADRGIRHDATERDRRGGQQAAKLAWEQRPVAQIIRRDHQPDGGRGDEVIGADRIELIAADNLARDQRNDRVLEQIGKQQRARHRRCPEIRQQRRAQHAQEECCRLACEVCDDRRARHIEARRQHAGGRDRAGGPGRRSRLHGHDAERGCGRVGHVGPRDQD